MPELVPGAGSLFYPLSPRLAMLLGTMYLHRGKEDLPLIDHLPDDDCFQLQEKAEELEAIEGERRALLLAQEIRRYVKFASLVGLDAVDPSWLLAAVRGEQPFVIGALVAQLSSLSRTRILDQLPEAVRRRVPPKEAYRDVSPAVMRVVRHAFELKFAGMPAPPAAPTHFYFRDVVLLTGSDLVQLLWALGVDELAAAFLTLGKRPLAEMCAGLGGDAANELVAAVRDAEDRDALALEEANELLRRLLRSIRARQGGQDEKAPQLAPEAFARALFQRAGLIRLAKALRLERGTHARQLAQRLPRSHGLELLRYAKSLATESPDEDRARRLQDLVLYRVERLAAAGKVDARWLAFSFCYWGEDDGDGEAAEGPAE